MKRLILVIIFLAFAENILASPVSFTAGSLRISKDIKSLQEIRKEHIVSQTWDYSCGPAALATILTYYFEDEVSEEEIINYLLLTVDLEKVKKKKGFSLLDLKQFAKARGYRVCGYKMDLDFLVKLDKPVLVPINIKDYHHFVVFRGLRRDRVFLADPLFGRITMRADKFLKIWTGGIGLVLEKNDRDPSLDTPLSLTEKEDVTLSDAYIQHILSQSAIRNAFSEKEF